MRLKSHKYVVGESMLKAVALSLYSSHEVVIHESHYYQCFRGIMSSISATATNVSKGSGVFKGNGVTLPISPTTIDGLGVMLFSIDYMIYKFHYYQWTGREWIEILTCNCNYNYKKKSLICYETHK